ncbi:unnamed protein product, partial [Medioppia subpectinata]
MAIGYYDHQNCQSWGTCGLDFRHNMDVITNASDIYSTRYFTDRCVHIIDQHNTSQPLFLYVPYQAVQVPFVPIRERMDLFPYIRSPERRVLAAMAYSMDESIGTIMEALHSKHMLDNSIVIFISDNGGHPFEHNKWTRSATSGPRANDGQNRPLRGGKFLLYEGGIRVPALVWSPLLNKSGYVSQALVHITDLLPTVLEAIDGTRLNDDDHQSVSQWKVLSNNERPVRWEIQHNVDTIENSSAIRWHDWKLIQTRKPFGQSPADYNHFPIDIGPHSRQTLQHNDRLNSKTYRILRQMNRRPDYTVLSSEVVECRPVPTDSHHPPDCMSDYCLFNVRHDPCEQHNLIGQTDRRFVRFLRQKMVTFDTSSVPPLSLVPNDPKSNPKLYNNTYVNWLDYYQNEHGQFITD